MVSRIVTKKSNLYLFIFSFIAMLGTTSCLSTEGVELASTIQVSYNIPDLNTEIVRNEDTLTVFSARLVFQDMQLSQPDDNMEALQSEQVIALYSFANTGRELYLVNKEISEGTYSGLNFDIVQPENQGLEDDPDASIVVTGQYNDELFKYASQQTFEKSMDFDEVADIAQFNSSLQVRIQPESVKWFLDKTTDEILDPNSSSNRSAINANILDSFQIQMSTYNSN